MTSKRYRHFRQFIVLVALLAFCVQGFASVSAIHVHAIHASALHVDDIQIATHAEMKTTPNTAHEGCHGTSAITSDAPDYSKQHSQMNPQCCADQDCSMMGCHSPVATLTSIFIASFPKAHSYCCSVNTAVFSATTLSLYRPPILF